MRRKIFTKPRKTAVQARSRSTVKALLDATARIWVKEGYDKASTNHIAEIAGVGVGSLYQYFPSKEALVASLIDRHNQRVRAAVQEELAAAENSALPQAVRQLVAVAVKAHRIDPQLHRVLTEQIPRVGKLESAAAFSSENYSLFEEYIRKHRDTVRGG